VSGERERGLRDRLSTCCKSPGFCSLVCVVRLCSKSVALNLFQLPVTSVWVSYVFHQLSLMHWHGSRSGQGFVRCITPQIWSPA